MADRTITLLLTDNDMIEIAEQINNWDKLWGAIGYLSAWAAGHYPTVTIWRDGKDADLVAHYKNADGTPGYTIGAVWHDTHYGFHS
jgi:hypothetical protein